MLLTGRYDMLLTFYQVAMLMDTQTFSIPTLHLYTAQGTHMSLINAMITLK